MVALTSISVLISLEKYRSVLGVLKLFRNLPAGSLQRQCCIFALSSSLIERYSAKWKRITITAHYSDEKYFQHTMSFHFVGRLTHVGFYSLALKLTVFFSTHLFFSSSPHTQEMHTHTLTHMHLYCQGVTEDRKWNRQPIKMTNSHLYHAIPTPYLILTLNFKTLETMNSGLWYCWICHFLTQWFFPLHLEHKIAIHKELIAH